MREHTLPKELPSVVRQADGVLLRRPVDADEPVSILHTPTSLLREGSATVMLKNRTLYWRSQHHRHGATPYWVSITAAAWGTCP